MGITFPTVVLGQNGGEDAKLAAYYYNKGQFDKAEEYYESLYKKFETKYYFDKYFDCLMFQEKYKESEKIVGKQIKRNQFEFSYRFKLAEIYEKTDRQVNADEEYEKMIADLSPVQSQVQQLGRYFSGIGKFDYALQTYEKGKKANRSGYQYNIELGELYSMTKQKDKMIATYLDLLDYSSGYLKTVQTYLSRLIDFEKDEEEIALLRVELLSRAQNSPQKLCYNEMLIWYYTQLKQYTGAIIQSKALDLKGGANGRYTFEIGQVCESNKVYDKAKQAYNYVMELGERSPYYTAAAQHSLEVSFLMVTAQSNYTKNDLNAVVLEFESAILRMGKTEATINIMERLAQIYAFYINEPQKAEVLLKEAIDLQRNPLQKAHTKILLGDVLLSNNEIWDASILYMQVANDFPEDKIGHEAKFKNAKVFYYDGEFEYAKAQLDVLKASTTKLIANDAMQLSLLLQDNLGMDTTEAPVQLFANADLLLQQSRFEDAIVLLDSIDKTYPFHALADEILYQKGLIFSKQKDWTKAIFFFQKVIDNYGFDILADDAIFKIAEIYDFQLVDSEKAVEYYKKILFEFPSSLYVAVSRERYRTIKAI
ncbi:hypothetical protein DNU06_09715 [Putridiphycobacter roseus]|uniref:Tetratricopeptide repeat protein n=1 Tax=Putridiphycobacter roseus TaxID=2219161 RepID=A0A2W1NG60_9FLAO|nr:tetratricopeptide repeat protein [Putridiphycobacter roseus]PZE17016.1 hypothetical protein DNU06_09715 [Putridiphycobacter roseus]